MEKIIEAEDIALCAAKKKLDSLIASLSAEEKRAVLTLLLEIMC